MIATLSAHKIFLQLAPFIAILCATHLRERTASATGIAGTIPDSKLILQLPGNKFSDSAEDILINHRGEIATRITHREPSSRLDSVVLYSPINGLAITSLTDNSALDDLQLSDWGIVLTESRNDLRKIYRAPTFGTLQEVYSTTTASIGPLHINDLGTAVFRSRIDNVQDVWIAPADSVPAQLPHVGERSIMPAVLIDNLDRVYVNFQFSSSAFPNHILRSTANRTWENLTSSFMHRVTLIGSSDGYAVNGRGDYVFPSEVVGGGHFLTLFNHSDNSFRSLTDITSRYPSSLSHRRVPKVTVTESGNVLIALRGEFTDVAGDVFWYDALSEQLFNLGAYLPPGHRFLSTPQAVTNENGLVLLGSASGPPTLAATTYSYYLFNARTRQFRSLSALANLDDPFSALALSDDSRLYYWMLRNDERYELATLTVPEPASGFVAVCALGGLLYRRNGFRPL